MRFRLFQATERRDEIVGQGNFDMFEWGWGVEPDPNYMLSTFTCGSRSYEEDGTIYANLSDSFYCNPEYDELFEQQATETDFAERQAIVREMQQMLYDAGVYLVTYYANGLEAYRNDRFTGWVPQPAENGTLIYQWGTWSYFTVAPVTAASTGDSPAASASPGATSESSGAAVEPEVNWRKAGSSGERLAGGSAAGSTSGHAARSSQLTMPSIDLTRGTMDQSSAATFCVVHRRTGSVPVSTVWRHKPAQVTSG